MWIFFISFFTDKTFERNIFEDDDTGHGTIRRSVRTLLLF